MEKGILNTANTMLYLDVSKTQFFKWRKDPNFPKPLKLGSEAMQAGKYWSVKSLDKWIASLDPNEKEPCHDCGNN